MKQIKALFKSRKFQIFFQVAIIGLAVFLLTPQAKSLASSWSDASFKLEPFWLFMAIIALIATNISALFVFLAISPKKLPFVQTFIAQLSTGFTNRLAPGGIGAAGLYTFFLSKVLKISKTEAALLVGANGLIGYIAFNITTIGIFALSGSIGKAFDVLLGNPLALIIILAVIGVAVTLLLSVKRLRRGFLSVINSAKRTFRSLRQRPARLAYALLASIGITLLTLTMLYASIQAAGVSITLDELLLVYIAGMLAVVASPTPSGLGAVELAMTAALTAATGASQALAAVLIYRVVSFWLPILPGYISFRYLTKKKLL